MYKTTIDNWSSPDNMASIPWSTSSGQGRYTTVTLGDGEHLSEGKLYMAYVIGWQSGTYGQYEPFSGIETGDTYNRTETANVPDGGSAEEIFAGAEMFFVKEGIITSGSGNASANGDGVIVARRQVAGTFGYFTRIPTAVGGFNVAKLRLVATRRNRTVIFGGFRGVDDSFNFDKDNVINGMNPRTDYDARLAGSTANDAFIVYEIDLHKWFPGNTENPLLPLDLNGDGYLDSGDSRRTELHDTEIEFVLGTTQTGTRSTVYGHTFIPDGALIPQNEPPRIVLSSNNWQQVNDVRIYVFKRNSTGHFTYYRPLNADGVKQDYIRADEFLDKFDISPYAVWWGGTDDMDETHSFTGSMVLESGEYRFLAVARDDRNVPADRRLTDPNVPAGEWLAWTEATTILEEATLSCTGRPEVSASELFSGHTGESVTIDGSGSHIYRTITLHRAVAGILMYVEHVPATIKAFVRDASGKIRKQDVAVKSLAIVHGQTISDRVLLSSREAVEGTLTVSETNSSSSGSGSSSSGSSSGQSNPPMPAYWLLRADITSNTAVRNGSYVNTSPENTEHPDAILKGAFVMPQQANDSKADKGKTYDNSLYLVFIGYDSYLKKEIALEWRPVRLVSDTESCDPLYYPILANHFYSIGSRLFAEDGNCLTDDTPIDLQEEGKVEITVCIDDCWNEYYGGAIGSPCPGLWVDPEWGEHDAGELQ